MNNLNNDLISLLNILHSARMQLVSRTCSENFDLFGSFFRFENNSELIDLLIECEFILWINKHIEIASEQNFIKNHIFIDALLKLMQKKIIGIELNPQLSGLYLSILKEKQLLLQSLIDIGIKDEINYQRLKYSLDKDKALFEREYKRLLNEGQ
ncbi:hypothetical protein [Neisseria montereyensis]|uniref:Uncharacterized protein n=1 Tax=Neisseria montereyensis TaxID=2973938 RepID=A0ABT2FEF6_9NEIS|nr:hypothetical protein [Neisseria montereyensis]MCS4534505.1 hypothetical protein [Neisseria montereyensis]